MTDNDHVKAGLDMDGVKYAFGDYHESNWIPATWISLMIDQNLWDDGGESAGCHRTNLALHV